MTRRRKLLLTAGFIATLTVLLLPIAGPPPLETRAYLQAVTGHEAVVMCATASPQRYGLVVRSGDQVVFEAEPGEPVTRHELRAHGLLPGTQYTYELRSDAGELVDSASFVTRSDDDGRRVHFAMIGDSGGQPGWIALQRSPLFRLTRAHRWLPTENEPRDVARVLAEIAPDFWLHTGDVIYPKGQRSHYWTGLFEPFGDLMRRAPCYPVVGNHDLRSEDGEPFRENFALPESRQGDRLFTFREGPLRVVGLDFNTTVTPDHPALVFLREVAESSSEPWLLVFNHYPLRTAYREHPRQDLMDHYAPLCRELGVDLICAGHDHNYQRFGEPGESIEIITGGGGKSLYEILHPRDDLVASGVAYHACEVEIVGAVLRFRAIAVDGRVLDEFEIDKARLLAEGRVRGNPARLARLEALAGRR